MVNQQKKQLNKTLINNKSLNILKITLAGLFLEFFKFKNIAIPKIDCINGLFIDFCFAT